MSEFDGMHVVVTGASGGLGAFVVETLLARGATCHLPIFEPSLPESLPYRAGERVHVTPSMRLDDEPLVRGFYEALPALDASIHLVGGFTFAQLESTSLADLQRMLTLNVVTCFLACREAVRAMRRTGRGGRIVNVAARPVLVPTAGMTAYAASKAGVAAITQTIAAETSAEGIFANAVVPSIIDTPANRAAMPDADVSRWPKPTEIAETIAHLASRRNALTSGALVPVYGRS